MVAFVTSFLTPWAFQPPALGKAQTQTPNGKQIEVRLVPRKKAIRVGDSLEVRVEIWNVGPHPFFIEKAIYQPCGPSSPLSLRLELGPPIKPQEGYGHGCAADCLDEGDNFARKLINHWTSLLPETFYGTVLTMDPDFFPQLKTPGRWRLRGTYRSIGGLSSGVCLGSVLHPEDAQQISALPYAAWEGETETNTVWVEVLRREGPSPR
jgi:hypothetical protein